MPHAKVAKDAKDFYRAEPASPRLRRPRYANWIVALLRSVSAGSLSFAGFLDLGVKGLWLFKACVVVAIFFCGSNLLAQRLELTDVQAQPVMGPGPGLRIALGGTVNSDSVLTPRTLTVTAGTGAASFAGAMGGSVALGALDITAAGGISLPATVTTSGTQTYRSPVSLAQGTTLTSGGYAVAFASTVNSASTTAQALKIGRAHV